MSAATILQWGLLIGYGLLLAAAVMAWPGLKRRSLVGAVSFLAGPHVVYYALFLIFPDVLDASQTMYSSIALRYQMLFIAAAVLIKELRSQWRR